MNGRTHQIDELRKVEAKTDSDHLAVVAHGSDEPIVVGEEVVVESFGIGIGLYHPDEQRDGR